MARLLKEIVVEEISSVYRAANPGARIVLMKRDSAMRKGEPNMSIDNSLIYKCSQNLLAYGTSTPFTKAEYHRAITKRAGDIRQHGETDAKAYTRCILDDDFGRVLYKAMRFAKGPEIEGDAQQDAVPRPELKVTGPAGRKMQALANDHHRANPRKSPEGSYAAVLTAPENAKLRAAVLAEEMTQHGGDDADERNATEIGKAVAAELAKMPPRHLAHAATLDEEGRGDFLAMSEADRDRAIAENPSTRDDFKYPTTKRDVIYKVAQRG